MRNLEKVVAEYLSRPTDFAVQIVGRWGYGKTYYYRTVLEDLIINTASYEDASKNYKPIYVSLFGLKSTEDIATKIVFDFYQSKFFKQYFKSGEKRKRLKITQSIFKIGLRGFLNFQKLGNLNDYMADIKNVGESVLDAHELVICFDDLERKDSALKIEDFTGYINTLVDEGIKVIIISNEDLLLSIGDLYKNLKEKIIGITVEYIPDTNKTIESIVKTRYSGFKIFCQFLEDNMDIVLKASKAAENNFRHVIFSLDTLFNIYSKVKSGLIDSNSEISEKVSQELRRISTLVMGLAIEYKSSNLKYSDLTQFESDMLFIQDAPLDQFHQSEKSGDDTKLGQFLRKYDIEATQYLFFDSIFNYVTSFDEFSLPNFCEEFKIKFHLDKGKIAPQYQLIEELSYSNCFSLSDNDYKDKTIAMIDYAKKGLFAPAEYLSVMHYAERLDNVLMLDLEEVKNQLIEGLSLSINKTPEKNFVFSQFEMSGRSSSISAINKEIHKAGMSIIKQRRENLLKQKLQRILELLINKPVEFENEFHTNPEFQSDIAFNPILNFIKSDQLFAFIKNAGNQTIMFFRNFLKDRYESTDKLKSEIQIIKELVPLITEYKNSLNINFNDNRIKFFVVKEFEETLRRFIHQHDTISTGIENLEEDESF